MDKIEGLGTTNKVGGSGAESSQPKLPDMPDLDVPEVPSAQAPDLPDLPDLPPVPNIPDAKIPGLDAMQKILDMISSKIAALRPPELPQLPSTIDLAGNLAGGALSAGFAAPPLTMGGQGTLGVTMNNDVSAGGGIGGGIGGGVWYRWCRWRWWSRWRWGRSRRRRRRRSHHPRFEKITPSSSTQRQQTRLENHYSKPCTI